ncbi:MAG: asparagine synthase-related protein [Planctomycetia bacterium]|nr:asparagine synthase-related protein [Planctomycetia bacterium]
MAGIAGFAGRETRSDVFQTICRECRVYDWYVARAQELRSSDGASYLAATAAGLGDELLSFAQSGDHSLLMYGVVFDDSSSVPAQRLLEGFLRAGKEVFATVEGRFQALIWDARSAKLYLTCDRFGTRTLYLAKTPEGLFFAPQMRTILSASQKRFPLDSDALVDFFTWGHYFHLRTSLDGVEVLPPAAFYTFDVAENSLEKDRYFSFTREAFGESKPVASLDEVAEKFHLAVRRQTVAVEKLGISLSGGLDARSILGMIPPGQLPDVVSVSLGVPGSADHRLASQLARLAGTSHHNYELNTDFLHNYRQHLKEMVRLTDGQYLSSSIVIPTLPFYRECGIETLLRGHAGELFHLSKAYAFSLAPRDLLALSAGSVVERRDKTARWAYAHLQAYMLEGVERPLFAKRTRAECERVALGSLQSALESAGVAVAQEPVEALWIMYLKQRVFREVALSMKKFDAFVDVRLPILDADLITTLFRLPVRFRMGESIQQTILERYRPDFLRVRNVNTGTFIGASLFAQRCASLRQRVFAKLRFPGYQPYERMGLWLRRELKPIVEELLLKGAFCDRGVFDSDTVRCVVKGHFDGENHTYLLLALMILETQFQMWDSLVGGV